MVLMVDDFAAIKRVKAEVDYDWKNCAQNKLKEKEREVS